MDWLRVPETVQADRESFLVRFREAKGDEAQESLCRSMLETDPHNHLCLLMLGALAKKNQRFDEAEEIFWRGARSHPYLHPFYAALAEVVLARDPDRGPLAVGLYDLVIDHIDLANKFGSKFAIDRHSDPKLQDLDEKMQALRAGETMDVRTTLRPYRLIYELLAAASSGLSGETIRQIVGSGSAIVPLLVGVLRGWISENLPEEGNAAARDALALLGEIGDTAAVGPCLEMCLFKAHDVREASSWALLRLLSGKPAESSLALRPFLEGEAAELERLALADHIAGLPDTNELREWLPELPAPLTKDPQLYYAEMMELTVYDFCEEGETLEDDDEDPFEDDEFDEEEELEQPFRPVLERNDPCWCGSGKKYKKCHLPDDEQKARSTPDAASTASKLGTKFRQYLVDFAPEVVTRREMELASENFFGGPPPLDVSHDMEIEFMEWLVHDHVLQRRSRTVIEEYLARNRSRLSEFEKATVEEWSACVVSLYEVTKIHPGSGVELEDRLRGGNVMVRDVTSSVNLVQWDLILTRVVPAFAGGHELSASLLTVPQPVAKRMLTFIRSEQRKSGQSWNEFLRANYPRIRRRLYSEGQKWMRGVRLATAEGDEFVFSKAMWEIKDEEALRATLLKSPSLEEDEDSFAFLEPAATPGGPRRSLGLFVIRDGKLFLETMSRSRLERGKQLIADLAGDYVISKGDQFQSVSSAMEENKNRPQPATPAKSIPPELEHEIVTKLLDEHYTKWANDPLPALNGKTPFEAVKTAAGRSRVEELLRSIENGEQRKHLKGEPWFDVNKIRDQLGLPRNES